MIFSKYKYLAMSSGLILGLTLAACVPDPTGPVDGYSEVNLDLAPGPSPDEFSSEQTLEARYSSSVLSDFNSKGVSGAIEGVQGVSIFYRIFEVPAGQKKGTVVLLPGRTEPVLKYAEVIQDLMKQGYAVYAMSHRGQGESGRMTSNPQMGYVEYFTDYVSDVEKFVSTVVQPSAKSRLFLLAHSMGGGISAMYLKNHPGVFSAAVLSSPMIGINPGAFPSFTAYTIVNGICSRGDGKSYGIGQGDYKGSVNFTDSENDVTGSEARFKITMKVFNEHPSLQLGGASNRWLCESFQATAKMVKYRSASQTPTLLLQAEADTIVTLGPQNQWCSQVGTCQKLSFPGSKHEILMESDEIRNRAMSSITKFFNHYSGVTL